MVLNRQQQQIPTPLIVVLLWLLLPVLAEVQQNGDTVIMVVAMSTPDPCCAGHGGKR